MSVDLTPYFDSYNPYGRENTAMAEWLARQPQEAWVWVAKDLNYDFAVPTIRWMIAHPQCDLAVAAIVFWTLIWDLWDDGNEFEEEPLSLVKYIVDRERREGFPGAGFGLPSARLVDYANQGRQKPQALCIPDIPARLFGPFAMMPDDPPPAYDGHRNPELRALFKGLGTLMQARA